MKLERLNEHQIRCTLNKEDLNSRGLALSELAYGNTKARALFRDMMEMAAEELDFETGDFPLMIEAIPINADTLVLLVTKVEDPEELDTRFSKFAPSLMDDPEAGLPSESGSMDDLFRSSTPVPDSASADSTASSAAPAVSRQTTPTSVPTALQLYRFGSLDDLTRLAGILKGNVPDQSSIYKDPKERLYFLLLEQGELPAETFIKICNVISEYGMPVLSHTISTEYLDEHLDCLLREQALQKLALMN